MDVWRGITYW